MKSFIEDSYVHPDAVKKSKVKAEAKLSLKIDKKSQLLFRGSLLGQLRKESYKPRGRLLGQNMVYTLLFWALYFCVIIVEFSV